MKNTRIKSPLFSGNIFDQNLGAYADKDGFRAVKAQICKLGSLIDGLASIRENRDPFKTQAQIEVDYKKSYEKAQGTARQSMDKVLNTILDMQENAHETMMRRTKLNQQSLHAAEIRQVLRSFGDTEAGEQKRIAFLSKAIDAGKAEIINAVIATPAELSFLTDRKANEIFDMYVNKHAPEYRQEVEAISKAEEMLKMAHDSFVTSSEKMRDPTLEVEAETAKQRADIAEQEFNKAMVE